MATYAGSADGGSSAAGRGSANGKSSAVGQGILSRLAKLEEQQEQMMAGIRQTHAEEMDELRHRLGELTRARREAADRLAAERAMPTPVLMEVNMDEIEAAVQAAAQAAQESDTAVAEVRKISADARIAASRDAPLMLPAPGVAGADGDFLVKRVNVNLDQVERAINMSDLVQICRAFGRPDSKYGNEVYCAVVPKKNIRVNEPMMMTHAQQYLPTAMVPKRFFFLEDLPNTVTRKALADTKQMSDMSGLNGVQMIENGSPNVKQLPPPNGRGW